MVVQIEVIEGKHLVIVSWCQLCVSNVIAVTQWQGSHWGHWHQFSNKSLFPEITVWMFIMFISPHTININQPSSVESTHKRGSRNLVGSQKSGCHPPNSSGKDFLVCSMDFPSIFAILRGTKMHRGRRQSGVVAAAGLPSPHPRGSAGRIFAMKIYEDVGYFKWEAPVFIGNIYVKICEHIYYEDMTIFDDHHIFWTGKIMLIHQIMW